MEQELHKLLQGITVDEFKFLYLVGISGIMVRFLFNLGYGIWWDPNTPNRFHLPSFIKGGARIIVSLFVMAMVIARFQEFGHYLVEVDFSIPTRLAADNELIIKITYGGSFITGSAIDDVVKRVLSKGEKIIKQKRNGTNQT